MAKVSNLWTSAMEAYIKCSCCGATLAEIYGDSKDDYRGLRHGGDDDNWKITKLWFTECGHLVCGKHLRGGGAPFHPQGGLPRAACPFCEVHSGDINEKTLHWVHGCSVGEYDEHVPESLFEIPHELLGASRQVDAAVQSNSSQPRHYAMSRSDKASACFHEIILQERRWPHLDERTKILTNALTNARQQLFSLGRDVSEFDFALIAARVSEVKEEQSQQMGRTSSDSILTHAINGGAFRMAQGTAPDFRALTSNFQTLGVPSLPFRFQPAKVPEQPTGSPPKRRRIYSTSSEEVNRDYQHTDVQPQRIQSRDLMPPPVRPDHTMRTPRSTAARILSRCVHQSNHTIDILAPLEPPDSLSSTSPASNARVAHEMLRFEQQNLTASNDASTASSPVTLTTRSQLFVNPTLRNSMVGVHAALELPGPHSDISPAISPAPNARLGREMHGFEQQSSSVYNGASIASHPVTPITRSRLFTDSSQTSSTMDAHAVLELPNFHLSISPARNAQAAHEMHELDQQNPPTFSGASKTSRSVTSTNRPRLFPNPTHEIVAQEHQGLPFGFELYRPQHFPTSITNTRIRTNSEHCRPGPAVMNTPGNLGAWASRYLLGEQAHQAPGCQLQHSNDNPTHTEDGLRWPLRRLEPQAEPPRLGAAFQMQSPPQIPPMSRDQANRTYHRRHNVSTLGRPSESSDFESRFLLPSHRPQQRTRSPNRREPQPVHPNDELDESVSQHVSRSSSINNGDISPIRNARQLGRL